jgi:L-asparaginase
MKITRFLPALLPALLLAVLLPADASAQAARKPRITVIGTGGTIAGQSETRTSFQNYRAGQKLIADMVGELKPQIDEVADVTTIQFGNRSSGGYDIPDYYDLTLAVQKALETADGVVVTTGTSTMDEFIYWSDLTVQSQKPVVYTGAMRPWTVVGTDAHANLFNAIVLAASGETKCMGSVIMLNDEFHAAKEVWKSDNERMDTFIGRGTGSLGTVDDLRVHTWRAPPRFQFCNDPAKWNTPFDLTRIQKSQLPRVEAIMGGQNTSGDEAVRAFADAGVKGIISATQSVSQEARRYAQDKGVVFVNTQRFRTADDNMMPQKARLLLMLSLAFSTTPEQAMQKYEQIANLEWGEQRPYVNPGGRVMPTATVSTYTKPKVHVIGTGGTIAGHAVDRSGIQSYRACTYPIDVMVDFLRPHINEIADVTTSQFGNRGSGGYSIQEYYDLTLAIQKAAETADAVVVTTGTGTQDEFVYWSEVTVRTQKPVVFTGAMRPWDGIGTDAHANLLNAIVLAASLETKCFGTVNILNDEVHAAREVWKSDNARMDTFIDRQVGNLGYVDERNTRTWRAPPRVQFCNDPAKWMWPIDVAQMDRANLPRVEMLMGYQGAKLDEAIRAYADAGVKGIVLAGGGGSGEARQYAESKGVVFVSTQRFRSGAENFMPQKARLLLLAALATSKTKEEALAKYNQIKSLEFGEQKPAPTRATNQAQGAGF